MSKHKNILQDLNKPYESNVIGLRAIVYFSIGLFLLIVITFFLMWFLMVVMESEAAKTKSSTNPLALTKEESLPPEPRLQGAPGFGVESEKGWVNFELGAPQAEYWELERQWDELLKKGKKDTATGTVISLPIEEAKQRLLSQNQSTGKSETAVSSSLMVSDASAGRKQTVRIR